MIKLTFKKIPSLAKYYYAIGFLLLITALAIFFYWPSLLKPIRLQQLFIVGAIIVSVGSVINCVYQFKSKD